MPSFPDSIFLFVLALLLFGPKRLPVLARELGKWVGEFRRASNEFKMQMEDELRLSEQADRNKQIAAMEAAAPMAPAIAETAAEVKVAETGTTEVEAGENSVETQVSEARPFDELRAGSEAPGFEVDSEARLFDELRAGSEAPGFEVVDGVKTPVPIAVSGELRIMPPKTGLPVAANGGPRNSALKGLLDALPAAETAAEETARNDMARNEAAEAETAAHGD